MEDRRELYLVDAYIKTLEAEVTSIEDDGLLLDKIIFYPRGGGQPEDRGVLEYEGKEYPVTRITKTPEGVYLKVDGDIPVGAKVVQKIDWDYRYKLMRHHTTLHILSAVVYDKFKAKVTGGTIYPDRARLDFDLKEFNSDLARELVEEVNDIIKRNLDVSVSFISREEAEKDPELIRTKVNLLPDYVKEIRLVKIGDVDLQADGGLHVKNTSEIGEVKLVKTENKGKGRKRISVSVL